MRNKIQYLYDREAAVEVILCNSSAISYTLHNHVSVFTVGLVLSGSVYVTAGDRSFLCRADRSFMIPPYMPHAVQSEEPCTLLTLCVGKKVVNRQMRVEEAGISPCDSPFSRVRDSIRRLLMAIPGLQLTGHQLLRLSNSLDLTNACYDLYLGDPLMERIKGQLEDFPEKQLSVEEMARMACVSKYHFIRSFKRTVGLTPHQFQIQNRVRKAQHLLNSAGSMTEVALAAGFCDQSHFIRHFQKYLGLTPSAYISSCRTWNSGIEALVPFLIQGRYKFGEQV